MFRLLLSVAWLVLPVVWVVPAVADEPVSHALTVTLEPTTHRLTVHDTVTLPPALAHKGARFTLNAALEISQSVPPAEKIDSDDEHVSRYVLTAVPRDGVVTLAYSGVFNFGLSDQKEEYTRGFRDTLGSVGPEGVFLNGASAWTPSFSDDLIRFTVEVSMPDDWHVIAQGNGTSRDDTGKAKWESAGLMEQVYLVGGPLHRYTDSAGAVQTLVYLHERDDALAQKYLDATARYIEMYRQMIGPYPYGKFALVENFWETGYGMPSFTLLGPQIIRFPFILTSSYPHEILHNWWGNSVFVDYSTGNWCEGLTAYLADHLLQEQRGRGSEYRRNTLQKFRDYVREGRDFPLAEFHNRHNAATEAVGYGKALMLFHMLRRHMGDDGFRAGLATLYRKQRGHRASFDDLRAAFESVAREDLEPFFTPWIQRTGAPALKLGDITVRKTSDGYEIAGSLRQVQEDDPFTIEVPVRVKTEAGVESFIVRMDQREQPLSLKTDSRPVMMAVDPMFDVFRLLDPRETPSSIGQVFGSPRLLAILPAAADEATRDRYKALMEGWQSDEHEIELVLDTDLDTLPADKAVWILGRDNAFIGGMQLDSDTGTIELGKEKVSLSGHSVVVVRRNPMNDEEAVGWLVIEPVAAFPGIQRKLPHYGKYSYLAFEGDEPTNVVKGQWDATDSPLVLDLRGDDAGPAITIEREKRSALAELPPVFSQSALMGHVEWLASPQRQGRGLGTPELAASARYIADAFAKAGLTPGGDNGTWFQHFTVAHGQDGKPVDAMNVVGVLPGTNTDWADQSVVIGAHYDHLGHGWPDVHAGDEGKIHPGADDNASGIAVLIELARNIASQGPGARNLVVVAFSAEECGRLGSQYYVEHPRFPLTGVIGMINLDTVGRLFDKPIAIHGTDTADEWQHIFRGAGFVTGIPSKNIIGFADGSDQLSFINKGVPAVQVFTGAHGDYHHPTDTIDKIDGPGLVKVATFIKEAVTYLMQREDPMTVRIKAGTEPAKKSTHGTRKVLFGTVPEFGYQGEGVRIASLVPDSPAAGAGLLAGDILVRIDNEPIADLRAFSDFLKTLHPNQKVRATVLRDGKEVTADVVVRKR